MPDLLSSEELIGVLIVMAFTLLGRLAKTLMDRSLQKRLEKEPPGTRAFLIPPFFNGILLMVVLILIPVEIGLPLAWLTQSLTDITMEIGLFIPAIMLPFHLFAILMIQHNFGAVTVTDTRVTRFYLLGKKTIPLADLQRINVRALGLPPAVALKGAGKTIRFPRAVDGYPELLARLKEGARISLAGKGPAGIQFPYIFEITDRRMRLEIISGLLLILIWIGLSLIGLWIPLIQGGVPPFSPDNLLRILPGILIIFGLMMLFLITIVIILYRNTLAPALIRRIILTETDICVQTIRGEQDCYAVEDLRRVVLGPVVVHAEASFDDEEVSAQTTDYDLHIQFKGGMDIHLKANRLKVFKQTPEEILEAFQALYRSHPESSVEEQPNPDPQVTG